MRCDAAVLREAISLHCDAIGSLRDKESTMHIYAIQVGSGQEAKVEELIRRFADESVIGEIFGRALRQCVAGRANGISARSV